MAPCYLHGALLLVLLASGCASPQMVPLLDAAGIPLTSTPSREIPLEVVTRSTGIRDPVPVDGSSVIYGDVETALGHAISSAAVPWADGHRDAKPEGYQMFVELIRAEASYHDSRLIVTLEARATLRTRSGSGYLAQTQVHCRQSGLVAPERGAPIVYACMTRLGRDLAGWLGGVQP